MPATDPASDLELLKLQAVELPETRASVAGLRGFVIARTAGAEELWIGSDVPSALARALETAYAAVPPGADPTAPPRALRACEQLLADWGWKPRREAGPSYLIESDVAFRSSTRIERSDGPPSDWLRRANPGNWRPLEWEELLDGRLGPWAMATAADRVIAICHTPCPMTPRAAECGVWTDPAFRGRGHAAAVTAAWAEILRPSGRSLFYSTDAANRSSQRVAARLKLRLLGWLWRCGEGADVTDPGVHPLSALHATRRDVS